jgi:multiple sugar transport system permease protein
MMHPPLDAHVLRSPQPSARSGGRLLSRLRPTGEELWGYAFIAPQVVGLLAFTIFPVLFSLYLCFANWNFRNPPQFTGLQNLTTVFSDPDFFLALKNTAVIVAGIVPLTICISLGLALLTRRDFPGLALFKTGFFLPLITTSVAIATVWYWLFAPDFGLINAFLSLFGIAGPPWLVDPAWAKVAIIIMISWQAMGYYYLLFLAGLKQIPSDYYEAAAIDGAGGFAQFRFITLPMISPTMFFVVTTMIIGAVSTFDIAFVLTRGGPVKSTFTIVMYIYQQGFEFFRMGEAAVASWVLFLILFIATFLQFRLSNRWVHYDN